MLWPLRFWITAMEVCMKTSRATMNRIWRNLATASLRWLCHLLEKQHFLMMCHHLKVKPFFLTTIHISENPRLRCKVDASTVRKPDVKAQAIPSYVGWGAGMEMWTFPLIGSILNILNLFFYYASLFGYGILWALNPWYLGIGLFEKNQDINFEKLTCQLLAHSNATPQLKPECFALQDKNLIGLKKKELPQFLSIMCTFRFYSTNCFFEKVENII